MTRKKVKLAYITNDSARKATFKKRKKGLMKKVSELSTLCGINACAIIYSPYDSHPEVWPSTLGVQRVLDEFKQMSGMEQSKKMVNQESFLSQRITKSTDQLKKQLKDNREKEMAQVMFQSLTGRGLDKLNTIDLNDLGWLTEKHLKEVLKRRELLKKNMAAPPQAATPPPPLPAPIAAAPDIMTRNRDHSMQVDQRTGFEMNMYSMKRQPWFKDLINPQEHIGFGGEDMILPFENANPNALWSNGFFP